MVAIKKPDGSVRPLHDGAHSVQVNNSIRYQDQIQCPGPPEVAAVVGSRGLGVQRHLCQFLQIFHGRTELVKVRREDWPYMACRADSNSSIVWINRVGTFGLISSARFGGLSFFWAGRRFCWACDG